MYKRDDITPDILRQLLRYDPDTGKLFWKERGREWFASCGSCKSWNSRMSNREAFTATMDKSGGYFVGAVLGFNFLAHRVCFAIQSGRWPDGFIDHINGDPSDNRYENLRCVSQTENNRNAAISSNNTSGAVGVYWSEHHKKWRSRIYHKSKQINLGVFDNIEDAICARKDAEVKYGYHDNHGRSK